VSVDAANEVGDKAEDVKDYTVRFFKSIGRLF
jgi:hypothetical protein